MTMLRADQGGRSNPAGLRGEYRPHVRVGDGELLGVTLRHDDIAILAPGEPTQVSLHAVFPVNYGELQPGVAFDIVEGGTRVVGSGVVVDVQP
ncbi:hypothetical protein AB0269_00660 [Microbacterium sp. NPDC077644]|uniref:hypothetical protein n=1 Tax=Microbacterium sp. NPDC077644 TaxID=3155055 RepID=UPI00344DA6B6